MSNAPERQMPRYKCHKEVWALKIASIEVRAANGHLLHPADAGYGPVHIGDEWKIKHQPEAGGYYVVYDDGYASYSPAAPFESGYSLVLEPHQQRVVDEKFALDEKLGKLLAFTSSSLFKTLRADEQERLNEQARHMQAYSNVLASRIAAF